MKLRMLLVAMVLFGLAALGQGAAGAAPPSPAYTVTCVSPSGFTDVTWQHAKVSQVRFEWAGIGVSTSVDVLNQKKPKGEITTSPGTFGATSVAVTFTLTDGSISDPQTAPCA
jgi:hypothetical protein